MSAAVCTHCTVLAYHYTGWICLQHDYPAQDCNGSARIPGGAVLSVARCPFFFRQTQHSAVSPAISLLVSMITTDIPSPPWSSGMLISRATSRRSVVLPAGKHTSTIRSSTSQNNVTEYYAAACCAHKAAGVHGRHTVHDWRAPSHATQQPHFDSL